MSSGEVEYIKNYKDALQASLQSLGLTLALVGLPIGFLGFTLCSAGGGGGDRLAMAIAGVILMAMIGGVLSYSRPGRPTQRLGRGDLSLLGRLGEDLLVREVAVIRAVPSAKTASSGKSLWTKIKPEQTTPRTYHVRVGQRMFQVGGARWLGLSLDEEVEIEYAARSGVVLSVNGLRERLALAPTSGPAEEGPAPSG